MPEEKKSRRKDQSSSIPPHRDQRFAGAFPAQVSGVANRQRKISDHLKENIGFPCLSPRITQRKMNRTAA